MSDQRPPRVSIGLPVFNGEDFVASAIDSILAQTFTDFELIISDNASTDGTEAICHRYLAQDPRIRYFRQPVNLGAAPNFNRAFELARGSKYFKWAAHDDWLAPTFVEECVKALEDNSDAVLCQSLVATLRADGRGMGTYDLTATGADSLRPPDRFRARLKDPRGIGVYGVIRSDVLASTDLMGSHSSGDLTLLAELALCGRFVLVPQYLFFNRCYAENYFHSFRARLDCTPQEELAWWHAPEMDGQPVWRAWKNWMLYTAYFGIVRRRVSGRGDRLRYYAYLLRSVSLKAWLLMILEPFIALDPRLFHAFSKLKGLVRSHWVGPKPNARADTTVQMK